MAISFEIPGKPVPYTRPNQYGRKRLTPPKEREYRRKVALLGRIAAGKTYYRKERLAVEIEVYTDRRADVDNLAKSINDGLNKVIWHDDQQIDELRVRRIWTKDAKAMRAVVTVALAYAEKGE